MKNEVLSVALSFGLIFSGCSKDDDSSDSTSQTKTQLLTAHSWKLTSYKENGVETIGSFMVCEKDNLVTFSTNGIYTEDEGPTKCSPSDPQIVDTNTWTFANNETMLVIAPGSPSEAVSEIVQLTSSTLKLRETYTDSTSTMVYEITFSK